MATNTRNIGQAPEIFLPLKLFFLNSLYFVILMGACDRHALSVLGVTAVLCCVSSIYRSRSLFVIVFLIDLSHKLSQEIDGQRKDDGRILLGRDRTQSLNFVNKQER